jgi:HlyD family secretion protein
LKRSQINALQLPERYLAIVPFGVILLFIAWVIYKPSSRWVTARKRVEMVLVDRADLTQRVVVKGVVVPGREVSVEADIGGEIEKVLVNSDQYVTKGQIVLKLRSYQSEIRLQQAISLLNNAKALLHALKARLGSVKTLQALRLKQYERSKRLFSESFIAADEMEQSEAQWSQAVMEMRLMESKVKAQHAMVAVLQTQAEEAKQKLALTNIYAPMSGMILHHLHEGEKVVGTGEWPGSHLFGVFDFESMHVMVKVDEREINSVKVGDSALVNIQAYDKLGDSIKGRVFEIKNSGKSYVKAPTQYYVRIKLSKLPGQQALLKPGMNAEVSIITSSAKHALVIPRKSILKIKDKNYVFLNRTSRAHLTEINVGIEDQEWVQVWGNVKENDGVLIGTETTSLKAIKNNELIQVVKYADL